MPDWGTGAWGEEWGENPLVPEPIKRGVNMARTFIRQGTQIRRSENFVDSLGAGNTLETGATTLEDDLNSIRSQIKRILTGAGAGRWFDDLPDVAGNRRSLAELSSVVQNVTTRNFLRRVQSLTDVTVPGGQNYLVLAADDAPTLPAAVSGGAHGAVVAVTAAIDGPATLDAVAGQDALNPRNLVLIRDTYRGNILQSDDRDIYGLLQAETGTADGDAFNDTDRRVRISFVRPNDDNDGFELCPVGDIENRGINYSYVARADFAGMPEDSFIANATFTDLTAPVDITLARALDNQGDAVARANTDVNINVDNGNRWRFRDQGGTERFSFVSNGATSSLYFNGAGVDIDNTAAVDIAGGLMVSTSGTPIDIGNTTPGTIAGPALTLTSGGQLTLTATGGNVMFDDQGRAGSDFAMTGIPLSSSAQDWNDFRTQFGEVSLIRAVEQAALQGARSPKVYANVTATVAANADVGGTGGGANLDSQLPDMTQGVFGEDYDVYVNGELQRPGGDAGADNDYYPGTDLGAGQLRFEYELRAGDVICVVPYKVGNPVTA